MSNISRLVKLRMEITKARTDIEKQQERLKNLEQRLLKVKQTEVMRMLDGAKMEPEQLQKVLADYVSDKVLESTVSAERTTETAGMGGGEEKPFREEGEESFEEKT